MKLRRSGSLAGSGVGAFAALGTMVGGVLAPRAAGQTVPLRAELVATGVNAPVLVTAPRGDDRLFIVQQDGVVRIVDDGVVLPAPYLSVPVRFGGEAGLLGLAFAPNYKSTGYFYVYASQGTFSSGANRVIRYRVSADDPDLADPASAQIVLTTTTSVGNHNGGWIGFSPIDGYLYAAVGDRAVSANATDLAVTMGKMLRLDVSSDAFPDDPDRNYAVPPTNPYVGIENRAPEIFDWGLRNPWRCAFDSRTGDLVIGDVGGGSPGEINLHAAATPAPLNFGWPTCDAGSIATQCSQDGRTPHIWTYPRSSGCATVAGYVYRGVGLPGWDGVYFAGDYCSGRIWTMRINSALSSVSEVAERTPWFTDAAGNLSAFGEDGFGELYYCRLSNDRVYRLVPAVPVGPDCNGNGVRDPLEIARGDVPDENGDGVPDGCPACRADFNAAGGVTVQDIYDYLSAWTSGLAAADYNGENGVTVQDLYDYLSAWTAACGA